MPKVINTGRVPAKNIASILFRLLTSRRHINEKFYVQELARYKIFINISVDRQNIINIFFNKKYHFFKYKLYYIWLTCFVYMCDTSRSFNVNQKTNTKVINTKQIPS